MEFDEVLRMRKSSRRYTDEIVSVEDEKEILKAIMASSVGKHNDAGYMIAVVRNKEILNTITREDMEKTGGGDPLYRAPLLFVICTTKETIDYLERFDSGIIAEHIQLKAAELGLGSVILFGFVRHLGHDAEYIKKMDLPEGVFPLLAVAVGHAPGTEKERKGDRKFQVIHLD